MITKESMKFLSDLKKNNNRDWFQDHKNDYEKYKNNYQEVIEAFLAAMIPLDDSLQSLTAKDCSYRINRDIRFTKDKTPYKTHMPIWMSAGKKNTNLAGYYIHLEKGESFIAGGVYWPDAADLKKIRTEIGFFHDDLVAILQNQEFKAVFGDFERDENNSLKTAPKNFEKDHPAIEYLRLKCFTVIHKIPDADLLKADFVLNTAQKLALLTPLIAFFNRALTAE